MGITDYFDAGKESHYKRKLRLLGSLSGSANVTANAVALTAINPEGAAIVVNAVICELTANASGDITLTLTGGKGANAALAVNATQFASAAAIAANATPALHSAKVGATGSALVNATEYIGFKWGANANSNVATLTGNVYVDYLVKE